MKIKIVDRLNPIVTFSLLALIVLGSILLGYYPIAVIVLIAVLSSVKVSKKKNNYQKYGLE